MLSDFFLKAMLQEKQKEIDDFLQQRKLFRLLNDDGPMKIRRRSNVRTSIMAALALIPMRRPKSSISSPEPPISIRCPVCGQELHISEAQLHERI